LHPAAALDSIPHQLIRMKISNQQNTERHSIKRAFTFKKGKE